jgi:AcrR family transcriptional regulator
VTELVKLETESQPATLAVLDPERPSRRRELLAAALRVIRRDGPNASMDAMAAEAGITKPILYRHFGDRDGLIAAVADGFADDLIDRLERALSGAAEPVARIEAAVASYVSFIAEDPALYGFLTQQAPAGSPALVGVVDRVALTLRAAMDETLAEVGQTGLPTETWAYGVVGMVHMAGAHWAIAPDVSRERLVEVLTDFVAHGLLSGTLEGPLAGEGDDQLAGEGEDESGAVRRSEGAP